jgi:hypothetical protein
VKSCLISLNPRIKAFLSQFHLKQPFKIIWFEDSQSVLLIVKMEMANSKGENNKLNTFFSFYLTIISFFLNLIWLISCTFKLKNKLIGKNIFKLIKIELKLRLNWMKKIELNWIFNHFSIFSSKLSQLFIPLHLNFPLHLTTKTMKHTFFFIVFKTILTSHPQTPLSSKVTPFYLKILWFCFFTLIYFMVTKTRERSHTV